MLGVTVNIDHTSTMNRYMDPGVFQLGNSTVMQNLFCMQPIITTSGVAGGPGAQGAKAPPSSILA